MRRCLLAMSALAFIHASAAQEKAPPPTRDVEECRKLEGMPGELECYRGLPRAPRAGFISDEWWLDHRNIPSTRLVPYRPDYVVVRATDTVNQQPARVAQPQEFDALELKMQLSLRGEAVSPGQLERWGGGRLRLWYAYTQQSNWQVLNTDQSRPFRDTNYEPEMILTYDAREKRAEEAPVSARPALVNFGIVHQSNGRSDPESRTWWRTYLQGGWQTAAGSLVARIWRTWRESGMEADNPDINDYVGRADLTFRTRNSPQWGGVNLLLRSNLRSSPHRGFLQLDWRLPWRVPVHLQVTSGYGESLLDYDHKQTTFGVGFSFWDW